MLDKNDLNRVLSHATTERYANDMRNGNWHFTGESISVFKDGSLANGQHRLKAIIRSGKPARIVVVRGVEHSAMPAFDGARSAPWATL